MKVPIPPELLIPGHSLLEKAGRSTSDEQLLDLLVACGLDVLCEAPSVLKFVDERLVAGPFFETVTLDVPQAQHRAVGAMSRQLSATLGRQVNRLATIRVAAAAGALSLGLDVCLL